MHCGNPVFAQLAVNTQVGGIRMQGLGPGAPGLDVHGWEGEPGGGGIWRLPDESALPGRCGECGICPGKIGTIRSCSLFRPSLATGICFSRGRVRGKQELVDYPIRQCIECDLAPGLPHSTGHGVGMQVGSGDPSPAPYQVRRRLCRPPLPASEEREAPFPGPACHCITRDSSKEKRRSGEIHAPQS